EAEARMTAEQTHLPDLLDPPAQGQRQVHAFFLHAADTPADARIRRAEHAFFRQMIGDGAPSRFLPVLPGSNRAPLVILLPHHLFDLSDGGRRQVRLLAANIGNPLLERSISLPRRRFWHFETVIERVESLDQKLYVVPRAAHGFGGDGSRFGRKGRRTN